MNFTTSDNCVIFKTVRVRYEEQVLTVSFTIRQRGSTAVELCPYNAGESSSIPTTGVVCTFKRAR